MRSDGQADAAVQEEQRAQTRLALGDTLVRVFYLSMFALCMIGTYHEPHPDDIKLGVVAEALVFLPVPILERQRERADVGGPLRTPMPRLASGA